MAQAIAKAMGGVLALAVLLAGCAGNRSGEAVEARQAVTSIQNTRQELEKARLQVDDMLAAVNALKVATPANLPAAYKAFNTQVAQTVKQAGIASQRAQEMREQGQQYIAAWEKETEQLSTPELKARAAQRRQTVAENYDRLREAALATDRAYQPFLTYLRDIQRSLSLDLTPDGVKAARPAFESVQGSGLTLKEQIDNFLAQIDEVLAVSPAKT